MLNVQIDDDYMLASTDPLNVTLVRKYYSKKKGEFQYRNLGYYPNVEIALKGYLKFASVGSENDIDSVNKLMTKLEEINQNIIKVGEKYDTEM